MKIPHVTRAKTSRTSHPVPDNGDPPSTKAAGPVKTAEGAKATGTVAPDRPGARVRVTAPQSVVSQRPAPSPGTAPSPGMSRRPRFTPHPRPTHRVPSFMAAPVTPAAACVTAAPIPATAAPVRATAAATAIPAASAGPDPAAAPAPPSPRTPAPPTPMKPVGDAPPQQSGGRHQKQARAIIGDELRIPVLWCEFGSCVNHCSDPGALGEQDLRHRALESGWRYDALGRLACPSCVQHDSAFWPTCPPAVMVGTPAPIVPA